MNRTPIRAREYVQHFEDSEAVYLLGGERSFDVPTSRHDDGSLRERLIHVHP